MKRFTTANTISRMATFFLLAASITYHLLQVFKEKGTSSFSTALDISEKAFQSAVLPSGANPVFILTK